MKKKYIKPSCITFNVDSEEILAGKNSNSPAHGNSGYYENGHWYHKGTKDDICDPPHNSGEYRTNIWD